MRSFRLALIALFIVAGVLGCAEADPWVGEWHFVVDIEAEIAEFVKDREEFLEEMKTDREELREEMKTVSSIKEFKELIAEIIPPEEPIDIEKEAKEYEAKLRAVGEDEGYFLTFERGRDGKLVAVSETRGAEDPADDTRKLSEEVTESSELIRCKFVTATGVIDIFELRLASEDLLEGSLASSSPGVTKPITLERVR